MTETNCSGCKKPMTLMIKNIKNDKKFFYKTCEVCRKKQKERYTKKKQVDEEFKKEVNEELNNEFKEEINEELNNEFKEEVKEELNEECYICFNEFEKGIKGIDCFQCKKYCCGKCYMIMFIGTRDSVKCEICRFQAHSKPYEGNLDQMKSIIQSRAIRCGYSYKLSWKWTSYAV